MSIMASPERVLVRKRPVRSMGRACISPTDRPVYRYPHTAMAQRMA